MPSNCNRTVRLRRYIFMRWKLKHFILFAIFCFAAQVLVSQWNHHAIPVFIIEEHHEALHYWMESAEFGNLGQSGNTLIHIDAHSDSAMPDYVATMPRFHFPVNYMQARTLLQKNDVFIMGAVMIGLIDRFIWVVPEWAEEAESNEIHSETLHLGLATVKLNSSIDKTETVLCLCGMSDNGEVECIYNDYSILATNNSDPGVPIDSKLCVTQQTYEFEVLTAAQMIEEMKENSGYLLLKEQIILDIDEDFFAVELPGDALLAADISWRTVELIDATLIDVFCPDDIDDEMMSQKVLREFYTFYVDRCAYNAINNRNCRGNIGAIFQEAERDIFMAWWKTAPTLFCAENSLDLHWNVEPFMYAVDLLTFPQLQTLFLKQGFCLSHAPKSFSFPTDASITICHGSNDPREPMVKRHQPSQHEFEYNVFLLRMLFNMLPLPQLVTIARSARDGYTPRDRLPDIERNVLQHFNESRHYEIFYDDDLLQLLDESDSRSATVTSLDLL